MKNWRTDLVAYAGFVYILIAMALVFFEKASLTEVTGFGVGVCLVLITTGFKLSKDGNK